VNGWRYILNRIRTPDPELVVISRPRPKARPRLTLEHQKASVGLSTDNLVAPTIDLRISWLVCEDCKDLVPVRQREEVVEEDQTTETSVDDDRVQSFFTCRHCR